MDATPKPPGALVAAWEIAKKDARIERRTGEIVLTAGAFAVIVSALASIAFFLKWDETTASVAAGTIWITLFFASVLSFSRVWQRERDDSALTWRSARRLASPGSMLSFVVPDPQDLATGDYDMLVRGHSPDHEEVVARFWLRVTEK